LKYEHANVVLSVSLKSVHLFSVASSGAAAAAGAAGGGGAHAGTDADTDAGGIHIGMAKFCEPIGPMKAVHKACRIQHLTCCLERVAEIAAPPAAGSPPTSPRRAGGGGGAGPGRHGDASD